MQIKTIKNLGNLGLLGLRQQDLQTIYEQSGKAAKNNEFQFHYYAAIYRAQFPDNSIFDIAIPTIYFNYPQEVTSAHIDFELKDVKTISDKLQKVQATQIKKHQDSFICDALYSIFGLNFKLFGVSLNSIHRHPGSSTYQSFSETDLDSNPNSPGIVFPLLSGNKTPNFASIIAIDNGRCNLAHTEYRLVTTEDEITTYAEGRCFSIAKGSKKHLSNVETWLKLENKHPDTIKTKYCEKVNNLDYITTILDKILPIIAIDPKNVKEKSYKSYYKNLFQTKNSLQPYLSKPDALERKKEIDHILQLENLIQKHPLEAVTKYHKMQKISLLKSIDRFLEVDDESLDQYYEMLQPENLDEEIKNALEDLYLDYQSYLAQQKDMKAELAAAGVPQKDLENIQTERLYHLYNQLTLT